MVNAPEVMVVDFSDPYQVAAIIQRLANDAAQSRLEIAALAKVIEYQATADGARDLDRFRGPERLRTIARYALGDFPASKILAALAEVATDRPPERPLKLVRTDGVSSI